MGKLWIVLILIHRKIHFLRYFILPRNTGIMIMELVVHGLRIESHAEREALGPSGPADRKAFGWTGSTSREALGKIASGDVRSVLRSTLPGPRVRALGVSFFARRSMRKRRRDRARRERARPDPGSASLRSAPGPVRQGTVTDPRPCTGGAFLTGHDSRCQQNFVEIGIINTRYCEINPGPRPQSGRAATLFGAVPDRP